MALMGVHANIGQPQSMWRQTPSGVSGAEADFAESARSARRHALILPREHGAWGLLLVPMVTGAGVAFRASVHVTPFLMLLTAALALFWLRTPVESLLGTSAMRAQTKGEQREVAIVIVILAKIAIAALVALLWAGRNPGLWLIGVAAVVAFVGQTLLKKLSRRTRMLSEIVGTIGLTSAAPAAYYVMTAKFDATAWMLWLANLIFAGNQIHYVQLRIHTARIEGLRAKLAHGWTFAAGQAVMTVVLTVICLTGLLPESASLAFAPLLFRGWFYFIQKPGPLLVRRLGWSELAHAVAFCVLFIATISLPNQ
jgi:YwiC-like protein